MNERVVPGPQAQEPCCHKGATVGVLPRGWGLSWEGRQALESNLTQTENQLTPPSLGLGKEYALLGELGKSALAEAWQTGLTQRT